MKPPLAPLIFAAFASITAPIALLLNTFNNHQQKQQQHLLFKHGGFKANIAYGAV